MCYAVVGKPFADWLKKQVSDRNHAIALKKDMLANMDSVIAQKLQESNHVSISKGKSVHLLKVGSKRRRGKEEIRQVKLAEANRDQEHELRMDQLRDAEQQMVQMRQEYEAMQQHTRRSRRPLAASRPSSCAIHVALAHTPMGAALSFAWGGKPARSSDLGGTRVRRAQLWRLLSRSFSTRFGEFLDGRSSLGALSKRGSFPGRPRAAHSR